MDFSYLNPLIPHLETELDDRENFAHGNYSNAVWMFSMDWLLAQHSRLSFTYLIDEFQLDQEDRDQKRPDATALQLRFAQSYVGELSSMTVYGLYNRVGSYTFRHEHPYTTFVSRDLPLGIPQGSDFYSIKGGFRWSASFPLLFELSYEHRSQGENNILQNLYVPYEEFTELPFPSGQNINNKITSMVLIYRLNALLEMEMGYDFTRTSFENNGSYDYYFLYSRLIFQFPWFQSL